MKSSRTSMMAACTAGMLCLTSAALAQAPAKPAAAPKGEAVISSVVVTATVMKIDQATREVTLKTSDGQTYDLVAGDAVKNLAQVKTGDIVKVSYTEALAYELRKGGGATGVGTSVAVAGAPLGAKPAGAIAQQTTAAVTITAIDPKVPSVTFRGPAGKSRTIKVQYPEKLQGVKVGDVVDVTYTEAIAITVEKAPKK